MPAPVVTRFAPSPTGFLHIGGARTALFNWLFARAKGGTMLLRIEDTDRERSTDEAIAAIMDGLTWLGLDWSGEPVHQFARADRHREVAYQLLADGHAYKCYCSQDELAAMREKARAESRPPRYDGTWRDRNPADAPAGVDPVIRFRAPRHGQTVIDDRVQGTVTIDNDQLDDLIVLRSDGNPTYMLSVVVDDHDMGITHVIRGDDHLTNAARQSQIYRALSWEIPVFAHIPLIHGPDGAKLSKRHGALGVDAYRAMGFLPAAMRNYLARLGWSHGDDEIFSTEQMIAWFDLDAIGRSPARFDFARLENLNGHYIRACDDAELTDALIDTLPHLPGGADLLATMGPDGHAMILKAMPGLKERAKTLIELADGCRFLFARRPLALDDNAARILDDDARRLLGRLAAELRKANQWTTDEIEPAVRSFVEVEGIKLGKIAQPLRAALTGTTVSPGIFDVITVLGREEALARIDDQAVPVT
jgi:glutamyl-tRNA synthetase